MKPVILLAAIGFNLICFGQDISLSLQKPAKLTETQRTAKWNEMPFATVVSFGSGATRYQHDIPPNVTPEQPWQIAGWKNEKVHTQIVIASRIKVDKVSVKSSDLIDDRGDRISSKNITAGFVQYTMTDEFKTGCGYRKSHELDSFMVADIINAGISSITVNENTTQPVWLTISIPHDAVASAYKGTITIRADKAYVLPLELRVADKTLPDPANWSFQLDYWQHPAAIARVHKVKLWSSKHYSLMRKYYTMLAAAGQKAITAAIVDEPWGHQTYDDYPGLIHWTKKKDGSWAFEYSLFDEYVAFVMSCGINQRINCYSMAPWKVAFKYFDEALQKDTVFTDDIGTPAYNAFWRTMLTDFTTHLKQKGWFDISYIAMDERPMKTMQSVIGLLKSIDPAWKVALAGEWHQEIESDIDDYCIASKWNFPDVILQKRKAQGKFSTWYTCCTEKYPNQFNFSPPDESVWAGWYSAASGLDGFLRWAYNSWTEDPLHDSRFNKWPAGDPFQVYPGPLSSIRFEKLIEGIQDFEKIKLLKMQYSQENQQEKLQELNAALQTFAIKELSQQPAHDMVEKHKHLLSQ